MIIGSTALRYWFPESRQVTVTEWVNPHGDDPLANCPELLV